VRAKVQDEMMENCTRRRDGRKKSAQHSTSPPHIYFDPLSKQRMNPAMLHRAEPTGHELTEADSPFPKKDMHAERKRRNHSTKKTEGKNTLNQALQQATTNEITCNQKLERTRINMLGHCVWHRFLLFSFFTSTLCNIQKQKPRS